MDFDKQLFCKKLNLENWVLKVFYINFKKAKEVICFQFYSLGNIFWVAEIVAVGHGKGHKVRAKEVGTDW